MPRRGPWLKYHVLEKKVLDVMSLIMTIYNQPLGIMDIIFKPPADLGISKQLIGS